MPGPSDGGDDGSLPPFEWASCPGPPHQQQRLLRPQGGAGRGQPAGGERAAAGRRGPARRRMLLAGAGAGTGGPRHPAVGGGVGHVGHVGGVDRQEQRHEGGALDGMHVGQQEAFAMGRGPRHDCWNVSHAGVAERFAFGWQTVPNEWR